MWKILVVRLQTTVEHIKPSITSAGDFKKPLIAQHKKNVCTNKNWAGNYKIPVYLQKKKKKQPMVKIIFVSSTAATWKKIFLVCSASIPPFYVDRNLFSSGKPVLPANPCCEDETAPCCSPIRVPVPWNQSYLIHCWSSIGPARVVMRAARHSCEFCVPSKVPSCGGECGLKAQGSLTSHLEGSHHSEGREILCSHKSIIYSPSMGLCPLLSSTFLQIVCPDNLSPFFLFTQRHSIG